MTRAKPAASAGVARRIVIVIGFASSAVAR